MRCWLLRVDYEQDLFGPLWAVADPRGRCGSSARPSSPSPRRCPEEVVPPGRHRLHLRDLTRHGRQSLAAAPESVSLTALGDTVRLSVQVLDQNGQVMGGAAVTWATSDASVAAVDGSATVTGDIRGGVRDRGGDRGPGGDGGDRNTGRRHAGHR